MIESPEQLIREFMAAAAQTGITLSAEIEHESQPAPHKPHGLPAGKCAVYVFTLSETYGSGCPAGAHRALKVGKAGPNSDARFRSQHYSGSAQSTLVGSLSGSRILWPYLGVTQLPDPASDWIRQNCDRDNLFLAAADRDEALSALEVFLRGHLGPVFEGTTGRSG